MKPFYKSIFGFLRYGSPKGGALFVCLSSFKGTEMEVEPRSRGTKLSKPNLKQKTNIFQLRHFSSDLLFRRKASDSQRRGIDAVPRGARIFDAICKVPDQLITDWGGFDGGRTPNSRGALLQSPWRPRIELEGYKSGWSGVAYSHLEKLPCYFRNGKTRFHTIPMPNKSHVFGSKFYGIGMFSINSPVSLVPLLVLEGEGRHRRHLGHLPAFTKHVYYKKVRIQVGKEKYILFAKK